jgi:predicted MFS family arabinose efflux permease
MPPIERKLVWVMAIACGVAVANNYYNQPLLADMGRTFGASARQMGFVVTLGQIGYAAGMLLFVPLGDLLERRRLIVMLMLIVAGALAAVALAPAYTWLAAASLLVGLTTVAAQVLIPLAAYLAAPGTRGKVVGSLYSGLLLGILLARTLSGSVGAHLGWRAMYWIAAVMAVSTALALAVLLPPAPIPTGSPLSYKRLLASLWSLFRTQPELREAAVVGGALFGAFSVFWTTLAFFLSTPPYHYGSQAAGLFGLVGAAGALAAPAAGRLADHRGPRFVVGLAAITTLLSWVVFGLTGRHVWGLVAGVILLDLGVQAAQVSNQTRIFGLAPHAQGRLNTVYMIGYFCGGSLGSLIGAACWNR